MKLAEKLVLQRKQKGLSQVQLAETIHVTRQAVSRWEVGDAVPSMDTLKRISELYALPMEYFLNDDTEEPEKPDISPVENMDQMNPVKRWNWKLVVALAVGIVFLFMLGSSYITASVSRQEKDSEIIVERGTVETNRELDFDLEY